MGCVSTTPSEPSKEVGKLQQPGIPVQAPPTHAKVEKAEVSYSLRICLWNDLKLEMRRFASELRLGFCSSE